MIISTKHLLGGGGGGGCYSKLLMFNTIEHLGQKEMFSQITFKVKYASPLPHLSLNCKGYWGTTDGLTTSFLHFSLLITALWGLANSRPVHSLMLSSRLFLCLPCLLPPFPVPCKTVLARPDERETCPYHCSLHLFTMVRRSSCGPITGWIVSKSLKLTEVYEA